MARYADIWHGFTTLQTYPGKARTLTALGVTLLTVGANGPNYDLSAAETLCRWRTITAD